MKVTLIESEDIGLIGVGEATIPPIRAALSFLGIDEEQFVAATAGHQVGYRICELVALGPLISASIRCVWHRLGRNIFHQHFLHTKKWRFSRVSAFSLTASAAKAGKFASTTQSEQLSRNWNYAFHLTALLPPVFREYAERLGVERVEGRVDAASTDENGYITEAILADGMRVAGEFLLIALAFAQSCLETLWAYRMRSGPINCFAIPRWRRQVVAPNPSLHTRDQRKGGRLAMGNSAFPSKW